MNLKNKLLIGLCAIIMMACNKDVEVPTRTFRMGFTPFPYEISETAANYVYGKLQSEADIINHHFDNGVPWTEALSGSEFPQHVKDDWNFRKSKTSANHKVYVSVTPINFSRNGLAAYRGETDNMELPSPWNTYSFNSMAIESNLLHVNNPSSWNDYLELHQFIYTELKKVYPELKIFSSVVGAHLLKDFVDGNDHVIQRLAVLQLLEYSDYYAVSFYPYMSKYLGNPYPENTFEELFNISQKPLVIAETGYAAQTFSLNVGAGSVTIESDQSKQQKFFTDMLEASNKRKAEFVINFVIRDYDQLWTQIGSPTDLNIAWRDSGLYDENGDTRLAYNTWKDYFARKHQIPEDH